MVEEIWPKLLLLLLLRHFRLLSKMLHEEIRQLRFPKYFFFIYARGPNLPTEDLNRLRSRTRVQTIKCF